MDYKAAVNTYKEQLIEDLNGLLSINSVKGEKEDGAPVGAGPKEALDYMLKLGERDGFVTKSVEGLAGHIEAGSGETIFGVLGHVDVVPPGDGWDSDPFTPVVRDGEIIARGVQDDKGPTMAAYYAMKILKEQEETFKLRTRLIIGTDEESDWQCTDAYFKHEAMPDLGFAPDADFPLIYGEKGMTTFNIAQRQTVLDEEEPNIELKVLISGERYNMVPGEAVAKLRIIQNMTEVIQSFEGFLREKEVQGSYEIDNGFLKLGITGKSAHGSKPEDGINAGFVILQFLNTLSLDRNATSFVKFADTYIINNFDGTSFDMAHFDEEMGHVSVNTGLINYTEVDGGTFGVNLRYPKGLDFEKGLEAFEEKANRDGFVIEDVHHEAPHYVNKDEPLVKVLTDSYRNHVDDDTEPFTIGGGTYARTMKKGVAFGAMFKDTPDTMHQKNERMKIDELLLATEIYLEALHRICIKDELNEN